MKTNHPFSSNTSKTNSQQKKKTHILAAPFLQPSENQNNLRTTCSATGCVATASSFSRSKSTTATKESLPLLLRPHGHLPPLSRSHCTAACPAAFSRCTARCPPVWCRCSHPSLRTTGSPWRRSPCRRALWPGRLADDAENCGPTCQSGNAAEHRLLPLLPKFLERLSTSHFCSVPLASTNVVTWQTRGGAYTRPV